MVSSNKNIQITIWVNVSVDEVTLLELQLSAVINHFPHSLKKHCKLKTKHFVFEIYSMWLGCSRR